MAQVSGETDRLFSYDAIGREAALTEARGEAVRKAAASGAIADSITIADVEETPMAYMPGSVVRIRVKAIGNLQVDAR
jgi:hypothetical protein